jgi:anionic cell wall polymer biosynthesis LytR-Cps2A-Psr (LCP) family protein
MVQAVPERLRRLVRTPNGAALLSFLLPGLGQAAAGKPGRGAVVAAPALAIIFAFLVLLLVDRNLVFNGALDQTWLTSLLILDLVALLYHLWAIADAYLLARRAARPKRRAIVRFTSSAPKWTAALGVGLIMSGTVLAHGYVASVDMDWQHALYCLNAKIPCWVTDGTATFDPYATDIADEGDGLDTPSPGLSASAGSPTPMPTYDINSIGTFSTTTDSQQWDADGQLNVLLLGLGVQANASALGPDTIMVLHLGIATGQAELISVGRNNYCTPLPTKEIAAHYQSPPYNCPPGTWGPMLNGLPNEILGHCDRWPIPEYASTCGKPGDENRYLRAYKGFEMTIGNLLGIHIDGSMWINPVGLTTLIDALGGVTIKVSTRLFDKPCGPSGTQQQKLGSQLNVPGTSICADTSHWGYYVPTGGSGIRRMQDAAAASGGGLTVYGVPGAPADVAFVIQPGTYHMNGDWALAYARTRIYDPQGDFGRAARQQNLLSSLRKTVDPCRFASLTNVIPLLGVVQAIPYGFNTDMDITNADNLKTWATLAKRVLGENVQQLVLSPKVVGMNGYAWDPTSIQKARALVGEYFQKAPTSSPGGSGASTC